MKKTCIAMGVTALMPAFVLSVFAVALMVPFLRTYAVQYSTPTTVATLAVAAIYTATS